MQCLRLSERFFVFHRRRIKSTTKHLRLPFKVDCRVERRVTDVVVVGVVVVVVVTVVVEVDLKVVF